MCYFGYMDIGRNIKLLRVESGLTQRELAEKIGSAASTISGIERGARTPRAVMLKKIAEHFGVTIDYLLVGKYREPQEDVEELRSRLEKIEADLNARYKVFSSLLLPIEKASPDIIESCPESIDTLTRTKLDQKFGVRIRSTLLDEGIQNSIYRVLWIWDKSLERSKGRA